MSMKPTPVAPRFWAKVEKRGPEECWEWKGAKNEIGYGMMWWNGRTDRAHRVSLHLHGVELPDRRTTGLVVDHICHNKLCVNPAHLRIVTQTDNVFKYAHRLPGKPGTPRA